MPVYSEYRVWTLLKSGPLKRDWTTKPEKELQGITQNTLPGQLLNQNVSIISIFPAAAKCANSGSPEKLKRQVWIGKEKCMGKTYNGRHNGKT